MSRAEHHLPRAVLYRMVHVLRPPRRRGGGVRDPSAPTPRSARQAVAQLPTADAVHVPRSAWRNPHALPGAPRPRSKGLHPPARRRPASADRPRSGRESGRLPFAQHGENAEGKRTIRICRHRLGVRDGATNCLHKNKCQVLQMSRDHAVNQSACVEISEGCCCQPGQSYSAAQDRHQAKMKRGAGRHRGAGMM